MWLDRIRRQVESGGGIAAVRQMIREMEYEEWLNQLSSSEDVAERRMGNVQFLLDSLHKVMTD